jgi:hypothetical protein
MKPLFKNYDFEFSSNEKKLLVTFCKQSLKQIEGDNRFFAETKAFNSMLGKLQSGEESLRLTKDEKNKLEVLLKQNIKYLKEQAAKSWFLKKWMFKSLYTQYENLVENHFKE